MVRATFTNTRLFLRALTILVLFIQQGLRWLLGWLWLVVSFAGRKRRQAWFGRCVLNLFRRLGATFIKVGQIMSTRPDLLPEYITHALVHLQDDVGPFAFAHVVRTIEEDLHRPLREIFAEFAPVPLASASVAQVHKARLPDGRVVAVKVRRPNLVELCTFDLAVMRTVAHWLGKLPPLVPVEPESAVEEFGRAVFAQLDFCIEANNNRRFRENFRDEHDVVFPEVLAELSSERILCMSFIEGTKILSVGQTRSDPKRIARLGMHALMKMIFEDGFVHADLHPGNIFITTDDRVALVDLGMVGELDPFHRAVLARFFAAWAQRDGDTMAKQMYSLSTSHANDQKTYEAFRASVIDFVGRYWGQRLADVQIGKVLVDMLGILRRHRIRMTPAFTIVNIAIAITEGIGKQLDPNLDLMAEAIPYFMAHPSLAAPAAEG
jgi:ubiquinone biosynthesis protein